MTTHPAIEREELFGAHNYHPLPVVLVKGKGVYVFDDQGKRYLDMMSAYSAVSHGHCHPKILKTLSQQASRLTLVSRAFYTNTLSEFLEYACHISGFEKALPMNTGAEAVETALKAARKWGYQIKGIEKDQAEIIACRGNFHGRTIAIIGMSSIPQYQAGFGPFPKGLKTIPYGDADALEAAITKNTAAFLVEPLQGEGGIIVPPDGYLKKCAEICKANNVLMICDEVQTGLGRTGKLFAFEYEEIKPDAIILGKALGGGVFPVSLFLSQRKVMDVFTPGDHGSTFGGNPLAAAVGKKALEIIIKDDYAARAFKLGKYFRDLLHAIDSPVIKEIRGKGLLIGVEVNKGYSARNICLNLLKKGILTKETHETVIRLAPPLIITEKQIDDAIAVIKTVLQQAQ